MRTTTPLRIAAGLLISVSALFTPAQAAEDTSRCRCWYDGYDEFNVNEGKSSCKNPPPISSANECDRDEKRETWRDGCLAHAENEARKCPYKSG